MKLTSLGALLVLFLSSFFFHTSCTKIVSTEVGKDLIPAIDNISTFDTTLEIIANNGIFGDSTFPRMGGGAGVLPDYALGYISQDPQFGTVNASIYFEAKPQLFPFYFEAPKDSLTLDSAVLCLSYSTTFGDTTAPQKIDVYALDTEIRFDSSYKTNAFFDYSQLLGTRTIAPKELDDSVHLFRDSLSHQLRIRLSDAFGNSLLQQDSSGAYKSDSAYRVFFKGFAIVPDIAATAGLGGNAVSYFSLTGANTYLRLYYKVKMADGGVDTTITDFGFIPQADGHANNILQNHNGSQLAAHTAQLPQGDSLIYIQTQPGSYATLLTNSINGFKAAKGNVIINRAELSMQQIFTSGENDDIFHVPNYLYVEGFDSTLMAYKPIPFDFTFDASGVPSVNLFGGAVKFVDDGDGHRVGRYEFVISRYLQNVVTRNNPVLNLRVWAPFTVVYPAINVSFGLNPITYGRVKLGGGNYSGAKMKLRIIYSKI